MLDSCGTTDRRGAGRDKWEEEQQKKKNGVSAYARPEDLIIAAQARRLASP